VLVPRRPSLIGLSGTWGERPHVNGSGGSASQRTSARHATPRVASSGYAVPVPLQRIVNACNRSVH
jgi:hypothetical protein